MGKLEEKKVNKGVP